MSPRPATTFCYVDHEKSADHPYAVDHMNAHVHTAECDVNKVPDVKGRIVRSYTAYCATCHRTWEERVPEQYAMKSRLRDRGWKQTKRGWVCPDCIREAKEAKK